MLNKIVTQIPKFGDDALTDPAYEAYLREEPRWIAMGSHDYHNGPGIGAHQIMTASKSLKQFHARHIQKRAVEPTESMKFGTLAHMAILEGERFREFVQVEPKFIGKTKDGRESDRSKEALDAKKAWHASLRPGTMVVTQDEQETICGMIDALLSHEYAQKLLAKSSPEVSGYAVDPETGLLMRIRPDLLGNDGVIGDYKTTLDAEPRAFARQAAKLKYHVTAGTYLHVEELITGQKAEIYVFIAQEKVVPYEVTVHVADIAFIEAGQQVMRHALTKVAFAKKHNVWPGYTDGLISLSLPDWALNDAAAVELEGAAV